MRRSARLLPLLLTAVLAAVGVLIMAPTDAIAAEARVVCNYDWVRVRAAASTSSRELGRLTRGTAVTGDQQGSWFRLTDGRFVAAYYTCSGAPAPAATQVAAPSAGGATFQVCRTASVRVRERATTSSRELRRLPQGTTMTGNMQGTWLRLSDGSGHVAGYYACAATAPAAPAAPAAPVAPPAPPAPQAVPAQARATHQVCRTPSVRLRERATTSSRELGRLAEGTPLTGTMEGTWLRLADGSGYVAGYYACPSAAPAPDAAVPASAASLLQPTGTLGSPTSPYGQRFHPILRVWRLHNGIDIGNRAGEPVYAAEAGIVGTVAQDSSAGLHLKIDHGTVAGTPAVGTGYLHLESVAVQVGQQVSRGQLIGRVGSTGLSTKPHLHFITYESGQPVNPEKYLGPLASLRA